MNSIYWLAGHIVWAENFLILKGLGGQPSDLKWINYFGLGAEKPLPKVAPPYEEILKEMNKIHMSAIKFMLTLSSEDLDGNNLVNLSFGANEDYSKRTLLHHALRHEPCHAGHLGWICRMNGIKTILSKRTIPFLLELY